MLIVYSAIFGRLERPKPPLVIEPNTQYIMYTDLPKIAAIKCPPWEIILVPRPHPDPILANRMLKSMSRLVTNAEETIYTDVNYQINCRLVDLRKEKSPLVVSNHPRRVKVGDERLHPKVMKAIQKTSLERQKFVMELPYNLYLPQCGMLYRQDCNIVRLFGEHWWNEIQAGPPRDQLFFDYSAKAVGLNYKIKDCKAMYVQNKHDFIKN